MITLSYKLHLTYREIKNDTVIIADLDCVGFYRLKVSVQEFRRNHYF